MGSLRTVLDIYYGWMNCIFVHKMQILGSLKSQGHSEKNGIFWIYVLKACESGVCGAGQAQCGREWQRCLEGRTRNFSHFYTAIKESAASVLWVRRGGSGVECDQPLMGLAGALVAELIGIWGRIGVEFLLLVPE